jgi:ribosome maturation factor RimP
MNPEARGVEEEVRALAANAAEATGAELVDMEFHREPAGWVLRLFIDKTGGVTVQDCQQVSEQVGTVLEVEDLIQHAYTLEVSSPGLTRVLRSADDWRRAVGSLVKVSTREPIDGRQSFLAELVSVDEEAVKLDIEGSELELPLKDIARARREIEWPVGGKGKKGKSGKSGKIKMTGTDSNTKKRKV